MPNSALTSSQRYAAAGLLSLALRRAQIDQARPVNQGPHLPNGDSESSSGNSNAEDDSGYTQFWTHKSHGLLRPIFQFLEIDQKSWPGLEKSAASDPAKDHAVTFLKIIFEEDNESTSKGSKEELVLAETVDSMATGLENASAQAELSKKKHESVSNSEVMHQSSEDPFVHSENLELTNCKTEFKRRKECNQSNSEPNGNSILGDVLVNYHRRVTLLFELLSACVADTPQESSESPRLEKGYDARHRTALRLLATWLDIKWIKMEAMEIMVACSAMAALTKEGVPADEGESENSSWSKWKHGGIIGAAALTGGTLMAITGGLAAPAIAAGFSALAPALGSLVPVIGTGFAAVASAAGSAAGSVAVAASFGAAGAGLSGSKMARRIGSIEEFEFKSIGDNHNQGVCSSMGIKKFVAVSTAIQDWLKSRLTRELMKQGAMLTVLGTLVSALAWPTTLLSALDFIDSTWSIAIDRSDKAGMLLAEVLLKNLQGNRPVTLIGFSLGARVIFKCLQQMAESGEEGLIEKVVLLGAPISSKGDKWESARKVLKEKLASLEGLNASQQERIEAQDKKFQNFQAYMMKILGEIQRGQGGESLLD